MDNLEDGVTGMIYNIPSNICKFCGEEFEGEFCPNCFDDVTHINEYAYDDFIVDEEEPYDS